MTIGTSSLWLSSIKDIDKELFKCVERVWPEVISRISKTDLEDRITERLVDILRGDREACDLGHIDIQFKLRERDKQGDYTTKGIIDIVLFLDKNFQNYIAYECKRLNTLDKHGKRKGSQAGKYVEEGVVRYVTAQYSEDLPYGCMIGYVMDCDQDFASRKVIEALQKREGLVKLKPIEIDITKDTYTEFETIHGRSSSRSEIVVRHRLFPIE